MEPCGGRHRHAVGLVRGGQAGIGGVGAGVQVGDTGALAGHPRAVPPLALAALVGEGVLHAHRMEARAQGHGGGFRPRLMHAIEINERGAVHNHPAAVIGREREGVDAIGRSHEVAGEVEGILRALLAQAHVHIVRRALLLRSQRGEVGQGREAHAGCRLVVFEVQTIDRAGNTRCRIQRHRRGRDQNRCGDVVENVGDRQPHIRRRHARHGQ